MKLGECPNCGSNIPLRDDTCICCHYTQGEPFFRPWWMDEPTWQLGRKTNWLPLKKKEKETPPSKHALAIMASIRKLTT